MSSPNLSHTHNCNTIAARNAKNATLSERNENTTWTERVAVEKLTSNRIVNAHNPPSPSRIRNDQDTRLTKSRGRLLARNLALSGTSVWRPQSRYTVSRIECRIEFPQNQRCRAKIALHPPKSRCRTFLRTPPPSQAGGQGGGGCRGRLVEGITALLGSENRSRYRGVSQLQSHQSRYSVQLKPRLSAFSEQTQHCGPGVNRQKATIFNVDQGVNSWFRAETANVKHIRNPKIERI